MYFSVLFYCTVVYFCILWVYRRNYNAFFCCCIVEFCNFTHIFHPPQYSHRCMIKNCYHFFTVGKAVSVCLRKNDKKNTLKNLKSSTLFPGHPFITLHSVSTRWITGNVFCESRHIKHNKPTWGGETLKIAFLFIFDSVRN